MDKWPSIVHIPKLERVAEMDAQTWGWIGFSVFVLFMLILDLGVFHRDSHEVKFKEAVAWAAVWISLALLFNLGVWYFEGPGPAIEFLTAFLLEKSLSVDNIFVFMLVFAYFKVPGQYQHKILFWGIIGALVLRLIFIFVGVALLERFSWLIYVFGGFLILTGIKMFKKNEEDDLDMENKWVIKLLRRVIPISAYYHEDKFFVRRGGFLNATPLFVVLVVIETTDVVFALDSIPAVLAISDDPFIIYTSNVFAILGLRALYFALAGFMKMFHYLHYGLALILVFIGGKMLAMSTGFHLHIGAALGTLVVILTVSVVASILWPPKEAAHKVALLGVGEVPPTAPPEGSEERTEG